MSKGLLFWIIWVLALLSFVGVLWMGWPTIYSGGVMLVLFGLLGWHNFGAPVQ
jgi:xanthine/uracil permease